LAENGRHALGSASAPITLVEFGSFNCPYCQAAHEVVANLRERFGERMRYVFRHRPISGNERALEAAVMAEGVHETGGDYWAAHDVLMKLGTAVDGLASEDLRVKLGAPARTPGNEAAWKRAEARVEADARDAAAAGAKVSPTFVINGRRYEGPWDEHTLAEAMQGSLGHRMQSAALDFARWAPSTGLLLAVMVVAAVAIANSAHGPALEAFWNAPAGVAIGDAAYRLPVRTWINDGLLTVFFLVVGLEIKRELTVGRLASRKAAALPIAAAAGGMLVPALLYLAIVPAGPWAHGWAIPTTTDTAFAVALIAILGDRVPVELRIFLTAAVVVDDLVAIAIVAIAYAGPIDAKFALASAAMTGMLVVLNRGGIYRPLPYALVGVALWACLHGAGLHATLAGIVVAMVTPTRAPANLAALLAQAEAVISTDNRANAHKVLRRGPSEPALHALDAIHDRIESPASRLLRSVEPWSSYAVLPVFAFANAGLELAGGALEGRWALAGAVVAGLVAGKPLGMLAAAWIAVRLGLAAKPEAYGWRQLAGAGALAGIGFTMSLYIADKALADAADFAAAKSGIFAASILATLVGTALLWRRARASADGI
jgi:NhaA family Na+:H+ antiporter